MNTEIEYVECMYFKEKKTRINYFVYPGELGEKIVKHISHEAWQLWQKKQIMLINEKKLNMFKEEDRIFLEKTMEDFLFNAKEIVIEGYKEIK